MSREEILYNLKNFYRVDDSDLDSLTISEFKDLINILTIEEILRIEHAPIKPKSINYSSYSDYEELFNKNMDKLGENNE